MTLPFDCAQGREPVERKQKRVRAVNEVERLGPELSGNSCNASRHVQTALNVNGRHEVSRGFNCRKLGVESIHRFLHKIFHPKSNLFCTSVYATMLKRKELAKMVP